MNDNLMKNFEERMKDKKDNNPKLHRFDMEFKVGVMAENDEDAVQKAEFIVGILKQFSDVVDVEKK
jgi:hypothetical protein